MIKDVSTTAFIGVLVILLSYALLTLILLGITKATPETTAQITTLCQGAIAGVTGYFFISSHLKKQREL
jgi:hypothetical protein